MLRLQRPLISSFTIFQSTRLFHTSYPKQNPQAGNYNTELKEIPKHYNHYQVLGISQSSTSKDIKHAFRKLSKKFHPDMNQKVSPKRKKLITNNYLKIVESYEILSNNERKSKYDLNLKSNDPFRSRSNQQRDFSGNVYYQKSYSPGGINRTRSSIHYGPGYQKCQSTYSNFDKNSSPTGLNHDVPHFDYDSHLKGNLSFERRMINKRIEKLYHKKAEEDQLMYKKHHGTSVHNEIQDLLNLERSGTHKRMKNNDNTNARTMLLVSTIGIIAIGGLFLH
ncbi:putative secreted protein [Wickerhamomyces ciferrii]|uniref:Secreted protein n=1 Tax=Wickerhamomyces ciferrii (strain ATCC 14091 / BCRC 22168 / CBS 111 / JCM 3599 / NBRC 0793 / NRRL Y-1031 F-60-10) TaxID=1206466 RepID=K0KKC5_WICCF|nr:uncharacterized protein BN7_1458 [Wickerhamomyces ciferrii]CCH41919.1 putative secreted protein [Wickerhamomyces ciferrii]